MYFRGWRLAAEGLRRAASTIDSNSVRVSCTFWSNRRYDLFFLCNQVCPCLYFLRLIQCVNGAVFLQLLRCSGQEGSLRRYDPKQVAVFHGQGQIVGREQDTFFFFPGELAKQPGYRPFIGDIQKAVGSSSSSTGVFCTRARAMATR